MSLLLTTMLFSSANSIESSEEKKDDSKMESGWRFDGNGKPKDEVDSKKSSKDLLEELLKVAKEQRDIQKKILKIMQDRFDPQPKEITLKDGTKCIANSSAKCFVMPLEPVGKQIPVLGKWVTDPTLENAKEWLKWEATYFNHVFKSANAAKFAVAKWGEEAYPTSFQRSSYNDASGIRLRAVYDAKINIMNSLSDEIEMFIFFGKDSSMDLSSFRAYGKLAKMIPNIKFTLVFKSNSALDVFKEMAAKGTTHAMYLNMYSKQIVKPSYFKKYNIYATPTLMSYTKKKKKMDILRVGKGATVSIIELMFDILEFNGVLKEDYMVDYKAYRHADIKYEKDYKNEYGFDLNMTDITKRYEVGENEK